MKPVVKWILEKDVFQEDHLEEMAEIIEAKGMEVKIVGYVPFNGGVYDAKGAPRKVHQILLEEDLYPPEACVLAYGSINLVRRLLNKAPWVPTAWMNLSRLACQSYYAHWGPWCLQREYAMMPWAEVLRRIDFLYETYGADNCIFVRPNDNTKIFTGKVVHRSDFAKWYDQETSCYDIDPDKLAIIAVPKDIRGEWRIVVSAGEVVTASQYSKNGAHEESLGAPEGAIKLASMLAMADWQPQPIYVIDVCLSEGEYKVMEIGDVGCAGLYACDKEKVVDAMVVQAEKSWKDAME